MNPTHKQPLQIPINGVHLEGMLELPPKPVGLVLFAHGSGSSRHSPRNNYVARILHDRNIGTMLMDLLTVAEDLDYQTRFDIELLTSRLLLATRWVRQLETTRGLPIGYFGASTGAAAAVRAAAVLGDKIRAIVSRGGRPDLAGSADLSRVRAPTLLLVGGRDDEVIELNRKAYSRLPCTKELSIIPDATHLFEEPGTLEEAARQAAAWLALYLK